MVEQIRSAKRKKGIPLERDADFDVLQVLLNSSKESLLILDDSGIIRAAGRQLSAVLAVREENLVGASLESWMAPDEIGFILAKITQADHQPFRIELRLIPPSGIIFSTHATVLPLATREAFWLVIMDESTTPFLRGVKGVGMAGHDLFVEADELLPMDAKRAIKWQLENEPLAEMNRISDDEFASHSKIKSNIYPADGEILKKRTKDILKKEIHKSNLPLVAKDNPILQATVLIATELLHSQNWTASLSLVLQNLAVVTRSNCVYLKQVRAKENNPLGQWIGTCWTDPEDTQGAKLSKRGLDENYFDRWLVDLQQNRTVLEIYGNTQPDVQQSMQEYDVHSFLLAPVFLEQEFFGVLGFEDCRQERIWSESEIQAIKTTAGVFGAFFTRLIAELSLRKSQEHYRTLVEVPPDAVIHSDMAGRILFANQKTALFHGFSTVEEIIGKSIYSLIADHDRPVVQENLRRVVSSGEINEVECLFIRQDGTSYPGGASMAVIHDEKDEISGLIWVIRDISERKEMQEKVLQIHEELIRSVAQLEQYNREAGLRNEMGNLLQSCLTVEEAFAVIAQFAEELFDRQPGAIIRLSDSRNLMEPVVTWGSSPFSDMVFSPDACWAMRRGRSHVIDSTNQRLRCEHIHTMMKAQEKIHYICVPMTAQGTTMGVLFQQISSEKLVHQVEPVVRVFAERVSLALANLRLSETLRMQSVRDPLTNLFNRRYMEETLEREFRRSERHQIPVGVIMIDLDFFKIFNDTYGHGGGDALLKAVANYLLGNVRASDIVCRYGGDEFALVMPEANLDEANRRAEQLRKGIKTLRIQYHNQSLDSVTASIGVTSYPEQGKTTEDILRLADDALYQVKRQGRDSVFIGELK